MKKTVLGGAFFLSAAIYTALSKPPDLITVAAIAGCLVIAGLTATSYTDWSIMGGGLLMAGSLFLQSLLSYRCIDCLRADLIILAGVIVLSVMEKGRHRITLRALASVLTVFMAGTITVHYSPEAILGKQLSKDPAGSFPVIASDGGRVTLDAAEKPVLFYSSSCGACIRTVEALAREDPEGRRWFPVQSYGEPAEGIKLLREKGYRGDSFIYAARWSGPVPAMVTAGRGGGVFKTVSPQEMLKIVRGDDG